MFQFTEIKNTVLYNDLTFSGIRRHGVNNTTKTYVHWGKRYKNRTKHGKYSLVTERFGGYSVCHNRYHDSLIVTFVLVFIYNRISSKLQNMYWFIAYNFKNTYCASANYNRPNVTLRKMCTGYKQASKRFPWHKNKRCKRWGGRNQLAQLGVRVAAAFYRLAAATAAAAGLTGTRLSYLTLRKVSAPNINMQKLLRAEYMRDMSPNTHHAACEAGTFDCVAFKKMPSWYAAGSTSPATLRFLCLTIDTMTNTQNMLILPIRI